MDFHYDPILGLQWFGNIRNFHVYLMDEIGHFPIIHEDYIKTNAKSTFIGLKFTKTIYFKK